MGRICHGLFVAIQEFVATWVDLCHGWESKKQWAWLKNSGQLQFLTSLLRTSFWGSDEAKKKRRNAINWGSNKKNRTVRMWESYWIVRVMGTIMNQDVLLLVFPPSRKTKKRNNLVICHFKDKDINKYFITDGSPWTCANKHIYL